MENNNLPVVKKNILPDNIKKGFSKFGKIVGSATLTGAFTVAGMVSVATMPVLILPSFIGFAYSGQKLLNNTLYKSHKDIAFITKRKNNTETIYQDIHRPDISLKLRNMSETEKAAFMQLQAIVGISKLDKLNKNGEPIKFETLSHGIAQKTFKKLESVGILKNYKETPKKSLFNKNKNAYSHLILPKIAFGNIKGLKDKVALYNISFELGDTKIDINDPKLIKAFPLVFSKRNGLLSKYNYNLIPNSDGTISIDYKADKPFIDKYDSSDSKEQFKKSLKTDVPTLEEQNDFSISIQENMLDYDNDKSQNKSDDELAL